MVRFLCTLARMITELIHTLTDSIAFTGTANMLMVKNRENNIKSELPCSMQSLCNDDVTSLFPFFII